MKPSFVFKFRFFLTLLFLINAHCTFAQLSFDLPRNNSVDEIDSLEYYFDSDGGIGTGTVCSLNDSVDVSDSVHIFTGHLPSGVHQLYVRVRDTAGCWSLSGRKSFVKGLSELSLPRLPLREISHLEYFIDVDPGYGSGIPISIDADTFLLIPEMVAAIGGFSAGVHNFYIRARDNNGNWGMTTRHVFTIMDGSFSIPAYSAHDSITLIEYFIDTDPGIGNGIAVAIAAGGDVVLSDIPVDISGLVTGSHTLFTRVIQGSKSLTQAKIFTVDEPLNTFWLSVTAGHSDGNNIIGWEVADESGVEHYSVERAYGGSEFLPVGEAAVGHSINRRYEFIDSSYKSDRMLYRIRAQKIDGWSSFSPVVQVLSPSPLWEGVRISNPNDRYLRVFGMPAVSGYYDVLNAQGKPVIKGSLLTIGGTNDVFIGYLPGGVYVFRIIPEEGAEVKSMQFIKL